MQHFFIASSKFFFSLLNDDWYCRLGAYVCRITDAGCHAGKPDTQGVVQ